MSFLDSENVFLSALQPNTSVSTYAVPSDIQLGHGTLSDEMSRAKRVQEQVKLRLAEKSTLPRQNGTSGHYASSEYGSSSAMKYQTYNPGFSSKSYVQTTSRPVMVSIHRFKQNNWRAQLKHLLCIPGAVPKSHNKQRRHRH